MKKFDIHDYDGLINFTDYEDLTPKQAICAYCLLCCAWDGAEVKRCEIKTCPLYKLKQKWFKIPKKLSPEDKENRRNRINNARLHKNT